MRLVLIRHGESEHGLQGMIAVSSACTGLTERGFAQVHTLADRLMETQELGDCDALLCSSALRARQTAEVVADALQIAHIEEEPSLGELSPGEAEGLSWEQYQATHGEFDLLAFPNRIFAPGGESWSDYLRRVRDTMNRLAEKYEGRTVVAATHAGFVVASILTLFDIPRPGTRARLDPVHTSLTEWHVSNKAWSLLRFNDACHMQKRRPV